MKNRWILGLVILALLVGCTGAPDQHSTSEQLPQTETPVTETPQNEGPQAEAPQAEQPDAPAGSENQQEQPHLYPAYQQEQGSRKWGYIDDSGTFQIPPQFDMAEEFGPDGLAIVYQGTHTALIDGQGRLVYPFANQFISGPSQGRRVVHDEGSSKLLDSNGAILFEGDWVAGSFDSGLTAFRQGDKYGYLNTDGVVSIEPRYRSAQPFADGQAIVELDQDQFAIIDTSGTPVVEVHGQRLLHLSEGIYAYQDPATYLWGYRSLTGDVNITAQFAEARPFRDGRAVVGVTQDSYLPRYGVIDPTGAFVMPPEFGSVEDLGDGLFAATQPDEDYVPAPFLPHALFDADGQQLTDFRYYDIVPGPLGLSVSDETSTYFIDKNGRGAPALPAATGIGTLRPVGQLIARQVDGTLTYLTHTGEVVWQAANTWALGDGATITTHTHRSGRNLLIHYPELTGLSNVAVQASINERLQSLFMADLVETEGTSVEVEFAVQRIGDILQIQRTGYLYPLGAVHGMPLKEYYHFDLKTGAEYQLADLFLSGSPYQARLQRLVREQLANDPEGWLDPNPAVRADQPFAVEPDGLVIYWDPYEIGPYAAGFPTFRIAYADLKDLLATKGPFWQSLAIDL